MKVAIKWKGEELKYIEPKELTVDDLTLDQIIKATQEQHNLLKKELQKQQESINKLTQELQTVKLENIEIVKGLITR